MNKFLLFIGCTLLASALSGQQTDTVYIETSEVPGTMASETMVDARETAYRLQEPARLLFKMDVVRLASNLGLELKLGKSFSINAGLDLGASTSDKWFSSFGAFIEPRWYMGMARRIREGKQANNLSGHYLGLELGHTQYNNAFENTEKRAFLFAGLQRRFLSAGFFDVGFGAGVSEFSPTPYSRGGRLFSTQSRARFGLGLVLPKSKMASQSCDVLRCFREERRMWKVDLFNLLQINRYSAFSTIEFKPTIAYEQKLGAAPFSIQAELQTRMNIGKFQFGYNNSTEQAVRLQTFEYGFYLQPRWYLTLKQRIANGESGNNLSGLYIGGQAGWRFMQEKSESLAIGTGTRTNQQWSAAPVIGIQHRFLRNGFVDFTIGAGYARDQIKLTDRSGNIIPGSGTGGNLLYLIGGLRVGWAW